MGERVKAIRKALGTTAEAGEFPCSCAFYKQRVFKATGSTKMYYSESKNDPLNQRNPVSYTHLDVYKRQDKTSALLHTPGEVKVYFRVPVDVVQALAAGTVHIDGILPGIAPVLDNLKKGIFSGKLKFYFL